MTQTKVFSWAASLYLQTYNLLRSKTTFAGSHNNSYKGNSATKVEVNEFWDLEVDLEKQFSASKHIQKCDEMNLN